MTLLTTLIPAYKPDYLGEVFLGLARQSFTDFRVILSDDSPDAQITRLIRDGHYGAAVGKLHLTVMRGPCNARRNHERLIDHWAGQTPLVHFHLDDDLIFPDFYRTHVEAHARGDYAASITPRWLSHADGKPAWTLPLPDFITHSPHRLTEIDTAQLFASTVPSGANWLGELNNIVFSQAGAARFPRPPEDGLNYYGLMDISALLEAGCDQPLVFIRDHQSVFRQHPEQNTRDKGSHGHRVCMLVWAAMGLHAWAQGHITAAQAVQAIATAVQRCMALYGDTDPVMNRFYHLVQVEGHGLVGLHAAFTRFWLELLASHPSTAAPPGVPAPAAPRQPEEALS